MAVKEFKVGARSRVLEAKEKANAELGAKVMDGLLPGSFTASKARLEAEAAREFDEHEKEGRGTVLDDEILYPPVPGPSTRLGSPALTGCGCAKFHLPNKADIIVDGVVHRYSKPCYHVGRSKQCGAETRKYIDLVPNTSIEDRVTALETVVAHLVNLETESVKALRELRGALLEADFGDTSAERLHRIDAAMKAARYLVGAA